MSKIEGREVELKSRATWHHNGCRTVQRAVILQAVWEDPPEEALPDGKKKNASVKIGEKEEKRCTGRIRIVDQLSSRGVQ